MTVTDPISDMLTRIRNAIMARHDNVRVPSSKMKLALARILKEEGFITDYEVIKGKPHRDISIKLRYLENSQPAISISTSRACDTTDYGRDLCVFQQSIHIHPKGETA